MYSILLTTLPITNSIGCALINACRTNIIIIIITRGEGFHSWGSIMGINNGVISFQQFEVVVMVVVVVVVVFTFPTRLMISISCAALFHFTAPIIVLPAITPYFEGVGHYTTTTTTTTTNTTTYYYYCCYYYYYYYHYYNNYY